MPNAETVLTADMMMNVIKKHIETMEQRQSSLPFKVRGREIKIREQFNKIVKAVQVFKDFGSSLAGLDPIHAGIPWAAVNLVLQVWLLITRYPPGALISRPHANEFLGGFERFGTN